MMILSSATFDERVEHKDIAENNGRDISYQELESFANKVLSADTTKGNVIFTSVEVSPEFPGGMKAFYEYLAKNVRYPDEAKKNNVSGKVIVQFVVERDGQLSEIKVLRGLGSGLDEEAARVLRASPNWKPGIQNGKPVRVAYTLPISFNTISKSGSQKASNQTGTVSPGSMEAKKAVTMLMSDKLPSNAIYIINGKKYNVKEGKEILKAISPNDIESINVIKADKIVTGSEEQGKNGIIEIILKKK
jgi:TonB family protein